MKAVPPTFQTIFSSVHLICLISFQYFIWFGDVSLVSQFPRFVRCPCSKPPAVLRSVGVWTSIRHAQQSRPWVADIAFTYDSPSSTHPHFFVTLIVSMGRICQKPLETLFRRYRKRTAPLVHYDNLWCTWKVAVLQCFVRVWTIFKPSLLTWSLLFLGSNIDAYWLLIFVSSLHWEWKHVYTVYDCISAHLECVFMHISWQSDHAATLSVLKTWIPSSEWQTAS